jgi:hypothetical protein
MYVTFGAELKRLAANPEETEFRFQRRNQQMFLILMTYITRSISNLQALENIAGFILLFASV